MSNCSDRNFDSTSPAGLVRSLAAVLLLAVVCNLGGHASGPDGSEEELEACVEKALAHYGDLFDDGLPPELASAETRCFQHGHPTFYFDPDSGERIEGRVADVLLVREMGDEALFSLEVQAANGHSCHVWGVAGRAADGYRFEKLDEIFAGSEPCRLRVAVRGATAEVEDLGNRCRRYYCGVRASIGRLELEERLPGESY